MVSCRVGAADYDACGRIVSLTVVGIIIEAVQRVRQRLTVGVLAHLPCRSTITAAGIFQRNLESAKTWLTARDGAVGRHIVFKDNDADLSVRQRLGVGDYRDLGFYFSLGGCPLCQGRNTSATNRVTHAVGQEGGLVRVQIRFRYCISRQNRDVVVLQRVECQLDEWRRCFVYGAGVGFVIYFATTGTIAYTTLRHDGHVARVEGGRQRLSLCITRNRVKCRVLFNCPAIRWYRDAGEARLFYDQS